MKEDESTRSNGGQEQEAISAMTPVRIGLIIGVSGGILAAVWASSWWASSISAKVDAIS